MNWKVGDRAVVYKDGSAHKNNGTLCTIVSLSAQKSGYYTIESDVVPYTDDDFWGGFAIRPEYLRPIYDGDEKTAWDDCVFVPQDLVFVENNDA